MLSDVQIRNAVRYTLASVAKDWDETSITFERMGGEDAATYTFLKAHTNAPMDQAVYVVGMLLIVENEAQAQSQANVLEEHFRSLSEEH